MKKCKAEHCGGEYGKTLVWIRGTEYMEGYQVTLSCPSCGSVYDSQVIMYKSEKGE